MHGVGVDAVRPLPIEVRGGLEVAELAELQPTLEASPRALLLLDRHDVFHQLGGRPSLLDGVRGDVIEVVRERVQVQAPETGVQVGAHASAPVWASSRRPNTS